MKYIAIVLAALWVILGVIPDIRTRAKTLFDILCPDKGDGRIFDVLWRVSFVIIVVLCAGYLCVSYFPQFTEYSARQDRPNNATKIEYGDIEHSASSTTTPSWFIDALPLIPAGGITAVSADKSVMWVQQVLRRIGYGQLAVDGNWGAQTDAAVQQFASDYGYNTRNCITYEMACHMLRMYIATDSPLRYITIYCP